MSAIYTLGGLLLTYRLARRFAGVFAAALATVALFLATPLVMYTFILMPWSHAAGFFLFALFLTLWLWDVSNRHDEINSRPDQNGAPAQDGGLLELRAHRPIGRWALLGLVGGLMAITREQLGLLLILPAFESLVAYINLLRARQYGELRQLVVGNSVFLLMFGLALIPQLAAYQILNGRPGPSPTVGGKLIWCSPHLLDTLLDFDPRPDPWCPVANDFTAAFPPFAHGALVWGPILAPALLGLALLWRRDRLLVAALALAFLAQSYINGVLWPTWHLAGAFGFRRLIECTPIFALGLAALLERLRPRIRRWPLLLAALFLVYWNIGLIAQWTFARPAIRQGLIWDGMARAQFVDVPGKVIDKLDDLIAHPCRLAKNQNC